ncbi:winged helix-turn-helix transcriptional regulator [Microbispora corallina]|uniref:Transcriptional regulator n=1 Tax=Microbispora corallina TaxID=83302 RepID=A0ABQ4GBF9_9ACTN|nr:winged helix-turn-helix transcriptional regulator [Microbispora corallina]GIH44362.1 transcriptional regulator [Microbispora corallina]
MVGKRKYDDGCAVAHALDVVGERWMLLVARELLFGPKRFTDLRDGMPGVSADVLTQRLRDMTASGIVQRRKLPAPASSWVYELTEWGMELEPIVIQLGRWASRSPALPHDGEIGIDSLVVSLRALFDPRAATGLDVTIALKLGEQQFRIKVSDGRLDLARGAADHADVTMDTDSRTLAAVLHGGRPLTDALASGSLVVDGPLPLVERFLGLFPLPEPAPLAAHH